MTEEENKEACSETGKSIQNDLCLMYSVWPILESQSG